MPAFLALIAVALYAPLIGWGIPYATAPDRVKTVATDEILPLEALAEMRSTFISAAPDRNFGYPWWHYFVVASAQAPYVAALMVSGDLTQPSPTYPFGLRDPVRALEVLTIIGRLVSVVMGAGIVLASFFFARALWGPDAGVLAAALTIVSFPMIYYSRTGNLDVPAFFWSAIGLAILATVLTRGLTTRRAVLLGVFAALGVAAKDQSVVLFLPLGFVLLLLPWIASTRDHPPRLALVALCAVVGTAVYLAATGMLIDPSRHVTHVHALFFQPDRVSLAGKYLPPTPHTLEGALRMIQAFAAGLAAMMSVPVLAAALVGWTIAVREARWHLIWAIPFITLFVLVIWLPGQMVFRYLLPLTLFVDAFAALALVKLRASRLASLFVPVAILLIGARLAMGIDLSYAQFRETRTEAAAWMREHARAGDRVEYFGVAETLPSLDRSLISRRVMGRTRWVGEFGHGPAVLEYLLKDGPAYLIVVPDWTSRPGMQHSADCPPEVYAALLDGSAGYALAAHFTPPTLMPKLLQHPRLDYPSVAPPVRIFVRKPR
jgi:hypothetical protein